MNILVLEWDISRFSGRMATMVRFADAFKELGHDVHMCSNWRGSEIRSKSDLFYFHDVKNLRMENFSWDLDRQYTVFPVEWERFDFIFAPYVAYGHLSELPNGRPTVCWMISEQTGWSKRTLEFWTNSFTVWRKLHYRVNSNMHVVIPPYDYSVFRERAREKGDRHWDIAYAARADRKKNIETFCKVALDLGLNSVLALLYKDRQQKQYVQDLANEYRGINVVTNVDKEVLASVLGNTKVYFHPSKDESCSIAIYEAMNAGCFPVCFHVGAVEEQLGGLGSIYVDGRDPRKIIHNALNGANWNVEDIVRRGQKFDKVKVLWDLRGALNRIERNLGVG